MKKPNFDKDMKTIFDRCRRGGLPDSDPNQKDDSLGIEAMASSTFDALQERKLTLHHWSYRTPSGTPEKELVVAAGLDPAGELVHDHWDLAVEDLLEDPAGWIYELMGKSWTTPEILFEFVTILRDCKILKSSDKASMFF